MLLKYGWGRGNGGAIGITSGRIHPNAIGAGCEAFTISPQPRFVGEAGNEGFEGEAGNESTAVGKTAGGTKVAAGAFTFSPQPRFEGEAGNEGIAVSKAAGGAKVAAGGCPRMSEPLLMLTVVLQNPSSVIFNNIPLFSETIRIVTNCWPIPPAITWRKVVLFNIS